MADGTIFCAVVSKVVGPATTVVCAGFLAIQKHHLYREGTKSDSNKLMENVSNMERKLLAEPQRIGGEESGDLLERKAQKLWSRLERLNAEVDKLELKFEALKMGNGTGGTAVL